MIMDYSDLRNKTIFDFTSDAKIIVDEFEITESREVYEAYARKDMPIETRIHMFMGLADLLKDSALQAEIEKQFAKEFELFGFE